MRKRLYLLLPDVRRAKQVFKELLLSHIEERYIHVMAREGTHLAELPEATVLQKSDAMHGLWHGLVVGGATGAVAGTVVLLFPPTVIGVSLGVVLAMALMGAVMGVWVSGMIASDIPNKNLAPFLKSVEQGKILMIVDVPRAKVADVSRMIKRHHPEADMRGVDPTIPAFP